ncbi:GNAT family N-acetyltransferase [Pseudomonas sp. CDFA 602]|uniref:GNAT family N-acetyltransferase n=1 Tax=Pseudomonas californiensis TaxID=2829823 RepID=UPI001E51C334|nr:GNAT family N-acetyltransferase [Pseudomonas californiensis]MCD5996261.1 GNAT family N-acetyltransferase [Pseudomonas californiensis]MCD6001860.1 GNAT family N-acetyltransferase [Pseudomonas californiensis]
MNIRFTEVLPSEIEQTVEFVMSARAEIFPLLDAAVVPADLAGFERVFIEGQDGKFLIARHDGRIIAAVGYLPYDHRFAQLDYAGRRTVEIVRLYVLPSYRGDGLASRLCEALWAHADAEGVEVLYLHTHPFLPGAIRFWEKQGFCVIDVENDPVWQTTHMECVRRKAYSVA